MIYLRTAERRRRRRAFLRAALWQARVALVGCCLGLFLAGQAVGQTTPAEESQTEVIRGTVVNAATQDPIPRALVYSPDNRYAMLTDGEGHFEFSVPTLGSTGATGSFYSSPPRQVWPVVRSQNTFMFMARKPGFLDSPDQVAHASSEGDLTISLMPESIIKGHVTAAGGEPAAGITVQLFSRQTQQGQPRWLPGLSARANSVGEFRFAELLPGSYRVVTNEWMDNDPVASLPGSQVYGYPPVYYPGVTEFAAAGNVELSAGQTVQADLGVVRQPYYEVRIPLANGNLNGGFNVSVQGQHGSRYELGYNMAEQRVEGMLPSGNYVVQVGTYGPNSVSGSVTIRVADAALQGPILTLTPNSSIPINVKEEFTDTTWNGSGTWGEGSKAFRMGGPRLYLQASVESADDLEQRGGGSLRPPMGPGDDKLVLEPLLPGRYWLRLSTRRGYIASATTGATDLLRQPLTIGAGSSAPIEVTLRDDGAEVDGSVGALGEQSASAAPNATRAWVYCVPLADSAGQFRELGVSEDGKFSAPMMAPGDYRIFAFSRPQSHLPFRDAEAMKPYEAKGQLVHLSAGQKTTVQVEIVSAAE